MGVVMTTRGHSFAAEGLVRYPLQTNNSNMPFESVLRHVQSALDSHLRVQGHYIPARVAAAATNPDLKMPHSPTILGAM